MRQTRMRICLRTEEFLGRHERILLRKCIREALRDLPYAARVDVFVLTDEKMRSVNYKRRGVDKTTDVLSFPTVDWQGGETPLPDPDTGRVFLGDILISVERTMVQCMEYNHSFAREIGFLAVHGTLHLLGYDHQTEEERTAMRLREEAVLQKLGLNR